MCNSTPINGQCTNFVLFDVALQLPLHYKGSNDRVLTAVTTSEKIYVNGLSGKAIYGACRLDWVNSLLDIISALKIDEVVERSRP